jgi:hypothetical protein
MTIADPMWCYRHEVKKPCNDPACPFCLTQQESRQLAVDEEIKKMRSEWTVFRMHLDYEDSTESLLFWLYQQLLAELRVLLGSAAPK